MKYHEKVNFYYNPSFEYGVETTNKTKSFVQISGKPTIRAISLYIFFIAAFIFFSTFGFSSVYESLKISPLTFVIISIIVCSIVASIVLIKSNKKFKNLEGKTTRLDIYQRDLPSKLRPAHVRMLLNDGLIDSYSLACTILDLIDRGYLKITRENNQSNLDLFMNKNLILSKTDKPTDDLLLFEKHIIDWFINEYGNRKEISSEKLQKELQNISVGSDSFRTFQAHVMVSFPLNTFYKNMDVSKKKVTMYTIFVISIFIPFLHIISPILCTYGLGCLMFTCPKRILTQKGLDEKDAWEDLKKYLNDFSNISSQAPEMLIIWNFYLTYSVALGIKGISSEEIKKFFGDSIYLTQIKSKPYMEDNDVSIKQLNTNKYKNKIYDEIEKIANEEQKKYEFYNK